LIDWGLSILLIDPDTGKKLSSARRPDRTVSSYFFAVILSLTMSGSGTTRFLRAFDEETKMKKASEEETSRRVSC
jgi:hypothetical protein